MNNDADNNYGYGDFHDPDSLETNKTPDSARVPSQIHYPTYIDESKQAFWDGYNGVPYKDYKSTPWGESPYIAYKRGIEQAEARSRRIGSLPTFEDASHALDNDSSDESAYAGLIWTGICVLFLLMLLGG